MKSPNTSLTSGSGKVYVLRHLETDEFVCLKQDGQEYLAAFRDGDSAIQLRAELGMVEFVDIVGIYLEDAPFSGFWLDGQVVRRGRDTGRHLRAA